MIDRLLLEWITQQALEYENNYREEDEIVNSPHSYTSLECSIYRTSKDGEIALTR